MSYLTTKSSVLFKTWFLQLWEVFFSSVYSGWAAEIFPWNLWIWCDKFLREEECDNRPIALNVGRGYNPQSRLSLWSTPEPHLWHQTLGKLLPQLFLCARPWPGLENGHFLLFNVDIKAWPRLTGNKPSHDWVRPSSWLPQNAEFKRDDSVRTP